MERDFRVLVTGFEPFGGSGTNPSALVAERLAGDRPQGAALRTAVLPVVGGTAPGSARAALDALLDEFAPDAVIHFGEAHLRGEVCVERLAVNLREYRIADNAGAVADGEPVVDGAPSAHWATLPVHRILAAVQDAGVPAAFSLSAGLYLCNEVMFHTLDCGSREGTPRMAGFVHVPQLEAQHRERPVAARPIPEHELLAAARAAVEATVRALHGR